MTGVMNRKGRNMQTLKTGQLNAISGGRSILEAGGQGGTPIRIPTKPSPSKPTTPKKEQVKGGFNYKSSVNKRNGRHIQGRNGYQA